MAQGIVFAKGFGRRVSRCYDIAKIPLEPGQEPSSRSVPYLNGTALHDQLLIVISDLVNLVDVVDPNPAFTGINESIGISNNIEDPQHIRYDHLASSPIHLNEFTDPVPEPSSSSSQAGDIDPTSSDYTLDYGRVGNHDSRAISEPNRHRPQVGSCSLRQSLVYVGQQVFSARVTDSVESRDYYPTTESIALRRFLTVIIEETRLVREAFANSDPDISDLSEPENDLQPEGEPKQVNYNDLNEVSRRYVTVIQSDWSNRLLGLVRSSVPDCFNFLSSYRDLQWPVQSSLRANRRTDLSDPVITSNSRTPTRQLLQGEISLGINLTQEVIRDLVHLNYYLPSKLVRVGSVLIRIKRTETFEGKVHPRFLRTPCRQLTGRLPLPSRVVDRVVIDSTRVVSEYCIFDRKANIQLTFVVTPRATAQVILSNSRN